MNGHLTAQAGTAVRTYFGTGREYDSYKPGTETSMFPNLPK